jgi:hypothetical protein
MLLQRRCASDYSVVGWRNVMPVTKVRFRAISQCPHETGFRKRIHAQIKS